MKGAAIAGIAGLMFASACSFGKNAADLAIASSPFGTMAALQTANGNLPVELLAVRDDGLVLQDKNARILFTTYSAIRLFTPAGLRGEYVIGRGVQPSASTRVLLSAISRYPQGLNASLERKLLDRAGQRELLTYP